MKNRLIVLFVLVSWIITMNAEVKIDDYLQGGIDCKKGKPVKENASDQYLQGYGDQYELEQMRTAASERHN